MDDRQPERSPGAPQEPSPELVLAAVARAVGHRPPGLGGAPLWSVLEHLALRRRSAHARTVRAHLDALERAGSLTVARVRGVTKWTPTAPGWRRLAGPAGAAAQALPESPQHRAWRRARVTAAEEGPRFQAALARTLREAERMLEAAGLAAEGRAPASDDWLRLGRRLLGDCRRLGSAWHCLHEWAEPDDAEADLDPPPGAPANPAEAGLRALRAGRRNVALWDEPD
jgi:hypothetical protein